MSVAIPTVEQSVWSLTQLQDWTWNSLPAADTRPADAQLLIQSYSSNSLTLIQNASLGFGDSGVFGNISSRGLVASPASLSSSTARGGIMLIRWQASVPPVGGSAATAAVAGGAGVAPLAGGPAISGLGAGAGQFAAMALTAPVGSGLIPDIGPDPGFGPIPELPPPLPWPSDGGVPGGGGIPGGGGTPSGPDPDVLTPPGSTVVVPEPGTFAMAAAGIAGLLIRGRGWRRTSASSSC